MKNAEGMYNESRSEEERIQGSTYHGKSLNEMGRKPCGSQVSTDDNVSNGAGSHEDTDSKDRGLDQNDESDLPGEDSPQEQGNSEEAAKEEDPTVEESTEGSTNVDAPQTGDTPSEDAKKNISIELLKICDALKNLGNKYFKENNYLTSLKYYTEAIDLIKKVYEVNDPVCMDVLNNLSVEALSNEISIEEEDMKLLQEFYLNSGMNKKSEFISVKETDMHIYYTNRSFCHMKLENYGSSIEDIDEALKINPLYAKAYYRKGCSFLMLSDLKSASDCFQKVLKLTKDKNSEIKLKQCKKLLFEQQFQKAIELEQKLPYYETVVLDSLKIENVKAPIYDRNNLSIDFLQKVAEYISVPNQRLNKKCVCAIILDVIKLLKELPTLVRLNLQEDETLTICGDIHGQFYDLLNIMKINGYPSETNSYLFNGDFVDRGSFSVEVIIFLFLAKLTFPNNVHLTRGNHETDNMNKLYGFLGELQEKYDEKMHALFSDSFKFLPLAYVLNDTIFICHGGIPSKTDTTLEDIEKIDRNTEPMDEGIMTDLLWSDPNEEKGFKPSKRGIGFSFGTDITESFLKRNNLSLIIRSHEVRDEGYSIEQNGMLYTVFSAPNYCDIMKNKGAFLKFKGRSVKPNCVTFTEVKHPNVPSLKYAHNLYQNI
ncbi:serine/threonine protein phosphatase 5, putative [Plasmodium knowlesi strain H]|uniref:Serine/threonine-protein phosphatase T n=3 Tax=Plasmodium knowlesi TaxID=5850 RepID=A0A5K1UT30_PLAKH|nr:serine/threonine protein phosphatase 5, putative [Plasmodium knowlesi strain H]OTN64634.1 putative Serine/threonine protein phosphatase 5 [Plasmodium knowlesi]CAA9988989.1 serine/threonine protein phosphatase 5, putative [Plasmodium knowlesi strain H]SBO24833.1 serine/threonine protein phosphatase 5, putative [Plasmodium knowlesi strain H]SBO28096.1 serine/threonine protein phosphatase 5, putative [Plasmodium knowlesi strain H]VVS78463.1 serine/threonine protein phosphatase 5, putative [Pla|eukprot:XP_002261337.1 serine/threonine protein phosphatase, putative [Plasmodium knowlesi strain H]